MKYKLKTIPVREWSPRRKDWENRVSVKQSEINDFFGSPIFDNWYTKNMNKPCKINKGVTNEFVADLYYNTDSDRVIKALAFKNFIKVFGHLIEKVEGK